MQLVRVAVGKVLGALLALQRPIAGVQLLVVYLEVRSAAARGGAELALEHRLRAAVYQLVSLQPTVCTRVAPKLSNIQFDRLVNVGRRTRTKAVTSPSERQSCRGLFPSATAQCCNGSRRAAKRYDS